MFKLNVKNCHEYIYNNTSFGGFYSMGFIYCNNI